VHRPPLAIGHTGPVCRWEVRISGEAGVPEERDITRTVRRTRAARFAFEPAGRPGGGGLDDYAGAFRPDLALEDLSHRALVTQCKEFALDVNLLVRAAYLSIAKRFGPAALAGVAREHWAAAAPIYVERLRRALGVTGDDAASLLKTLQLDPALPPDYVDKGCALLDERHGLFWVNDCEALADDEPRGWPGELGAEESPGLAAALAAVNPRARCRHVDPAAAARGGAKPALAYEIEIDPAAEPREESRWARAARFSSASSFVFRSGPR
jgi:hypothetical protein